MPHARINNISVEFPFEPYDVQKEYMAKIITSLQTEQNAILESPSGTGKTLSLLCATLAWLKHNDETQSLDGDEWEKPKVIYATRTHSQILQAMKELKKTAYNDFEATVIASRDQLCIHPDLHGKSNTDKTVICKSMMIEDARDEEIRSDCVYYQKFDRLDLDNQDPAIPLITDIEDLRTIVNQHGCCPYFLTKKRSTTSDIVFIPYGYLIDPKLRETEKIDLNRSIVIIDEAHNVNRVCEDSASTSITDTEITAAIRNLSSFIVRYSASSDSTETTLKRSLQQLRERLRSMPSDTKRGGHLFQLLESVNITQENYSSKIRTLELIISEIIPGQEVEINNTQNGGSNADTLHGSGLRTLLRFLQTVFSSPEAKWDSGYRMHIEKKLRQSQTAQSENAEEPTYETTLHFWCFDPEIRMRSLLDQNIRSLILTSSTLAPFDALITELGIEFPIKFISQHVIERHQKFAKILPRGFGDELLDSKYDNRSNESYLLSIGQSIREIGQRVPGGLLVFFPSYAFMETCMNFWGKENNEGIWNEISQQTTIFIEKQDKEQFTTEIKNYYKAIRDKSKATFLAVARGKMSEGLDFSDIYGRAVMMVGIPFAPNKDPKVQQKMRYLDEERNQRDGLPSGNDWYVLDAIRTTNQAMGRVIRHKHDYGALFLCDKRFKKSGNKQMISSWIRARLNTQRSFDFNEIVQELSLFYTNAAQELPMHDPEINPESFVLHEDEEWFFAIEAPAEVELDAPVEREIEAPEGMELGAREEIPIGAPELSNNQATNDETIGATINESADLSNSNEITDEQPTIQPENGESSQRRQSPSPSYDHNFPSTSRAYNATVPDDSDDQSGVQPKRTKRSVRNAIESDADSNRSQNGNASPLITFLRTALDGDKYEKLEEIVSQYNNDGTYRSLRDGLFEIFNEPKFFYSLKGCVILFKHEHKSDFNKDCEQFITFNRLRIGIHDFFETR